MEKHEAMQTDDVKNQLFLLLCLVLHPSLKRWDGVFFSDIYG
jgi:hypothetical protein